MKYKVQFVRMAFEPVGLAGEFETEADDPQMAASLSYAKFNRGSGEEVSFRGPSMSVDDMVVVIPGATEAQQKRGAGKFDFRFKQVFQCASVGWKRIYGAYDPKPVLNLIADAPVKPAYEDYTGE